MKMKICKNCNKQFNPIKNKQIFCSVSCNNSFNKTKKENRKCLSCDKEFDCCPSSTKKYCSKICGNKSPLRLNEIKTINCKNCGKEVNFNSKNEKLFCNRDCDNEYRRKNINLIERKVSKSWVKKVKERDNHKCRVCGETNDLSVHHIIPYRSYPEIYDLEMNGATLCKTCHHKYDEINRKVYGTIGKNIRKIDNPNHCFMATIPHELHRYPSCGDYEWTRNGTLIIFVSDMNNDKYHYLIFLHEYIESMLCQFRGIKEKDITTFDIFYEMRREMGFVPEDSEPGDDDMAPYKREHQLATKIERMIADELNINWDVYDRKINSL